MPNVTCDFDAGRTPQFIFDPSQPVHMNAAGVVVVNRKPGQSWTFTGFNSQTNQLTAVVTPAAVTITDAHTTLGSNCYTVTVSSNNISYTSPDPVIVNDPPTPEPGPRPKPKPKP